MAKDKEEKETSTSWYKNISFPYNTIFLIVNAILLIIDIFWFVAVSTLHYNTDECKRLMIAPGIFVSFSFLTLALTGFYAAYLKSDCLFRIHFFIFFLWMFVVVVKAVFIVVLNKETNPRLFPGTNIHEFKLEDYSDWVRRLVIKEDKWYRTRKCLMENACLFSNYQNIPSSEFYQMDLTPIQSGCCKPPLSCGYDYEEPNVWKVSYNNSEDDCNTWNNNADTLCFDCDSCKAAIIADLRSTSSSVTFCIFHVIFSFSIGIIGWFAWLKILRETQN